MSDSVPTNGNSARQGAVSSLSPDDKDSTSVEDLKERLYRATRRAENREAENVRLRAARDEAEASAHAAREVSAVERRRAIDEALAGPRTEVARLQHALVTRGVAPAPAEDARPVIKADPTEITRTVNEALRALATQQTIYVRARTLVTVVRDRCASDWLTRPEGAPVIVALARERLRELLGLAAEWQTWARNMWNPVAPPTWVVDTLLAREDWPLQPLEGIVDAPAFRADGSILDVAGYDQATRLIYEPGRVAFPPVPAEPSQPDAVRAYAELLEPLADFPWVALSDRAAFVALVLTTVGRPAIDGPVPLYLITAPTPGSGKGLLVDGAAIIATGRAAPKMAPVDSDDETRKRILALALESPAMIVIDNVEGDLGSPSLASALTSGEIRDRVLGSTKTVTATLRSVWCATGNNVALKRDLARRVVPIGLDPGVEHPEDREGFAHPDLLAYLREHRPRLVVAALTILRAFVVAGRPAHDHPAMGSFEAWDRLVRGAIIFAGGADPFGGVERMRESGDSDRDNLRSLLVSWHAAFGTTWQTAAQAVARFDEPLRTAIAANTEIATAKNLGYVLRKIKGRPSGGLRLAQGAPVNGSQTWRVEPI